MNEATRESRGRSRCPPPPAVHRCTPGPVCPASPATDGQAPAGALRAGTQERQAAWMSVVSGLWGTLGAVGRTD